ncbi:hypothetical protein HOLleu_26304 [Holothuria leucospilota]|uniref:Uncharacterized protein n=1 Tax=Holothuria leucospilota TaxID=206669 RepID=A0A9Q1BU94_HOLLE|nr:hypothetical protein HOLleu_26304 [Holothuria leucospilota]
MLGGIKFSLKWTRLDSAPSPSPVAAHSGPIPIPEPPIPGQFRVQKKLDSSPELSPSPDSGVTALLVNTTNPSPIVLNLPLYFIEDSGSLKGNKQTNKQASKQTNK